MKRHLKTLFTLIACLALLSAATAQVMINEMRYDTQGDDDTSIMYTEIYGPPGTSLAGWQLVGINGNGGAPYLTVNLSGSIPADGYFVVGGSAVSNVDQVFPHDWQNAGSSSGVSCDGIDLLDGDGELVDHLCYGECDGDDICTGEGGTNAPDPFPSSASPLSAIARIPDHQDTDVNGDDWQATTDLTPGAPNEGEPCEPMTAGLEDIRLNDANGVPQLDGTFVITEGIVTIENGLLNVNTSIYMQDENAGVNIFGGTIPQGTMPGDCLRVHAWVSSYNGLTELVASGTGNCVFSVEQIGSTEVPDPVVLTGSSFFESFEGMLARIDNLTITGGDGWPAEGNDASITVTDGNGVLTLRIEQEGNIDGTPAPQEPFSVIGIIAQFDHDAPYDQWYQITPRYPSDIDPTSAVGDDDQAALPAEFRFDGAYPNPFNSTTALRYTVGNARDLTVRVFDLLGREVAVDKLTNLTPGSHEWNWSPSGATGLYIVQLSSANAVETAKVLYLK